MMATPRELIFVRDRHGKLWIQPRNGSVTSDTNSSTRVEYRLIRLSTIFQYLNDWQIPIGWFTFNDIDYR